VTSAPAPEVVPELVRGAALLIAHELVHVLWVVLSPSPVHELGREASRGVGREVVRVSLGLPEVQKA
jgi:hypothetical protein